MSASTLLKVAGGIAAAVILGAVGSGVWERLLAPGLDALFRASVDLISTVSLNYKNGIYKSAAQGFHEDFSLRLFAITLLLLALAGLIYAIKWQEDMNQITSHLVASSRGWLQWIVVVGTVAFTLSIFYVVGRHNAVNRTTTYAVRSMEILRPHIGEQKYLSMMSEFYQIRSAEQFQIFNSSLVGQAQSFGVTLPEFKPL